MLLTLASTQMHYMILRMLMNIKNKKNIYKVSINMKTKMTEIKNKGGQFIITYKYNEMYKEYK